MQNLSVINMYYIFKGNNIIVAALRFHYELVLVQGNPLPE